MNRLEKQSVVVTGGASGLGAAIVERFINEGANVCVLDRSEDACAAIQKRYGDQLVSVVGDVRSYADNEKVVQRGIDKFGGIDCVIGNAGIWDYNMALVDIAPENIDAAFQEMFDINVKGYILLAKAALKPLVKSKGSMIFTVSNAGFWPSGGGILYTTTKHAVIGMIKQLAFEFAPHVRVNGVAPGAIATQLKGPASLGMDKKEFPGAAMAAGAKGFIPVGKMPTPEEYAGAYVFFASREDKSRKNE